MAGSGEALEYAGDPGELGSADFASPPSPSFKEGHPQWVAALAVAVAILPFLSWCRRRRSISLLVALAALTSIATHLTETVGNYAAIQPSVLGMDATYWQWADRIVSWALAAIALLYACQVNSIGLWAVGGLALLLLVVCEATTLKSTNGDTYAAFQAAWHVVAFTFVALIPGMLPMSVDDPDYYYDRRRRARVPQHVPVTGPRLANDSDWDPDFPGMYIPRGENYFQ